MNDARDWGGIRVILSEVDVRPIATVAHLANVFRVRQKQRYDADIGFLDKEKKTSRVGEAQKRSIPSFLMWVLLGRTLFG